MLSLLLTLLALTTSAQADERLARSRQTGETVQIVDYNEDGLLYLDEIGHGLDGWPELRGHRTFANDQERGNFITQHYQELAPFRLAAEAEAPVLTNPAVAGGLWTVKNSWNWDWEQRFADWIRAEVTPDFFVTHQIATDCADVAYALRWIFSRINGLPMTTRLSSGEWFTQASVRGEWQRLKTAPEWQNDQRFRAALNYVLKQTYTHSLLRDAYPVAIRKGSLLEGGFQLFIHDKSGHTQPLTRVMREGESGIPIEVLQSTTPRTVRQLMYDGYWNPAVPELGKGGLLRFRWPVTGGRGLVSPTSMPNFSEEQFAKNFVKEGEPFFLAVFRRLRPDISVDSIVRSLVQDTQTALVRRVDIVNEGFAHCQTHDCAPNTSGWEDWSTPSRDGRIGQQLIQMQNLRWRMSPEGLAEYEKIYTGSFLTLEGWPISLQLVQWGWMNLTASPDPRVPPPQRWGLSPVALHEAIVARATNSWKEREELVTKNSNCRACMPGSELWKKNYTGALDASLQQLWRMANLYCQAASADACAAFLPRLKEKFPLVGQDLTLGQTLDQFLLINADPRHSPEVRRGGMASRFNFLNMPNAYQWESGKSWLATQNSDNSRQLWDIRGAKPVEIPAPVGEWKYIHARSGHAWYADGQTLGLVSATDSVERRLTLPFQASQMQGAGEGAVLAFHNGQWALVEKDTDKLQLLGTFTATGMKSLGDRFFLMLKDQKVEIVDFSGSTPKSKVTELAPAFGNAEVWRTQTGWILRGPSDTKQMFFLARKDLALRPLPFFPDNPLISSDGKEMVGALDEKSGAYLKLNESGEVVNRRDLSRNQGAWSTLAFSEGGQSISYFLRQGKIVPQKALAGEKEVLDLQGDMVVARKEKSFVLRPQTGGRAYAEATQNIYFMAGNEREYGLVQICDMPTDPSSSTAWQTACRLENFRHPEQFSIFTGLSPWNNSVGQRAKMERGFVLNFPPGQFWLESRDR